MSMCASSRPCARRLLDARMHDNVYVLALRVCAEADPLGV